MQAIIIIIIIKALVWNEAVLLQQMENTMSIFKPSIAWHKWISYTVLNMAYFSLRWLILMLRLWSIIVNLFNQMLQQRGIFSVSNYKETF